MTERAPPKKTFRRITRAALLLSGVAVLGVYALRRPIAEHYIDEALKARGVAGRYQLTQIDPNHQRLEHVIIGDPTHPDLTADWVETETDLGFGGGSLVGVKASGVRLLGRMDKDGSLHFGVLDTFRTNHGKPFSLPDLGLDLADAELVLQTPYGEEHARLDGKGNLARDFDGHLSVQTAATKIGKCDVAAGQAKLSLLTRSGQPHFIGPVRTSALHCAETKLANVVLNADVTLSPNLHNAQGTIAASSTKLETPLLAKAAQSLSAANGTPLAPFGEQYRKAILALGGGMAIKTAFSYAEKQGIMLSNPSASSQSGAILAFTDPTQINISPAGALTFAGNGALRGGGFPESVLAITGTQKGFKGSATFAPLAAPNTRLVLTPLTFSHDTRGTTFATSAAFDGAIAGGMVRGLRAPLAGIIRANGSFSLAHPCTPLAFESLSLSGLALGKTNALTCLSGNDLRIGPPRFVGKIGTSPFAFAAADARYNLASKAFTLSKVTTAFGTSGHQTTLSATALSGTLSGGEVVGKFTNISGRLPNVPLALDNSSGTWRFANGALTLNGNLSVADTDPAKRFEQLVSNDIVLSLKNSLITANGTLSEPKSGAFVSHVNITHNLATDKGDALIDINRMPLLQFGKALQPEALTRITLGVIANLKGAISGQGRIHWSDKGVTSDGDFATEHLDLAAAFGPVNGMRGEIHFTDLLGLVTAPHQIVYLKSVNPGVEVRDGVINYRLLLKNQVEIEGGSFPFAGGNLILLPAVLDLSEAAERRLTFRVDGMDAAKFVNEMQFEDIAATGIFDGELPLVFDSKGGRIEAGQIAVRAEGGTVSYVGAISNASLGRFSKLAFDALKSIKYHGLTIDVNGALDGEMVSLVKFSGTNQSPLAAQKSYLLKQITGIPFKFNIRINAPFRSLFQSAKNLQDPSDLVQQSLPKNLKASAPPRANPSSPTPKTPDPAVHIPATSIQPKESEPVR